jgi:carboxyl-terminal processing protease
MLLAPLAAPAEDLKSGNRNDDADADEIALFREALDTARKTYVDPVDKKAMVNAALKGMLSSLDSHSSYMTAEEYQDFHSNAQAEFGGIGVVIAVENGIAKVVSPVEGSPSARLGIESGYTITEIDGAPTLNLSLPQIVKKLRGPIGASVNVTFLSPQKQTRRVTIVREAVKNQTVFYRMIGKVAYIRISGFSQGTAKEFDDAIAALKQKTADPAGLILDLRNNGGGFVDAAIEVSSRLLPDESVVVKTGRKPAEATPSKALPPVNQFEGVPIVAIINGGSASAAEIVAGAIKDNHRGVVIGMTSWGKGLVQTIIPLKNGEKGALSVTAARYYTPLGASIQKTGIIPDLQVARAGAEVKSALEGGQSEATLANVPDNETRTLRQKPQHVEVPGYASKPETSAPPLFPQPVPTDDAPKTDFQMQRALDILLLGGIEAARLKKPAEIYTAP